MTEPTFAPSCLRPVSGAAMRRAVVVLVALGLCGCASGDFGRVPRSLVSDDMHDWIGTEAVGSIGEQPSQFALTDDERTLRDLAYPLIKPPYERNKWVSVLAEYGKTGISPVRPPGRTEYWANLVAEPHRSEASRYAVVNRDARNDVERLPAFFGAAGKVIDIDRKRMASLAYVHELSPAERDNATRRTRENRLIVDWVCASLQGREASYRYALERLVVTVPSDMAVDTERSLNMLRTRVAGYCGVAARA